jgi:capsule polysaccharide modification protein KpsS
MVNFITEQNAKISSVYLIRRNSKYWSEILWIVEQNILVYISQVFVNLLFFKKFTHQNVSGFSYVKLLVVSLMKSMSYTLSSILVEARAFSSVYSDLTLRILSIIFYTLNSTIIFNPNLSLFGKFRY